MQDRHYKHWPTGVPKQFPLPETSLCYNLEVAATRYARKTAIFFYGGKLTYAELKAQADALAGYLQQDCGVRRGDRVLLYMQNSPQFVIAYYAILRADAVVVPVNPMNLTAELTHYASDAGAKIAICGHELLPRIAPLLATQSLARIIYANYADYIDPATDLPLPDFFKLPAPASAPGIVGWGEALAAARVPGPHLAGPDDLAALPYTSGTTGQPKGCMHTHRTLMGTIAIAGVWARGSADDVSLAVVPFFHVTGMQMLMNGSIYLGAGIVVMTRWDRELALKLIERHQVTSWINIPTMVIDLFASPNFKSDSLKSLRGISGGGAAMPEAVAKRLYELTGLEFCEGYGLTETAAPTHSNHPSRPKRQCLGHSPVQYRSARHRSGHAEGTGAGGDRRDHLRRPAGVHRLLEPAGRDPGRVHRARRQALLPHRRPRALRRGRLFLHRRPPEAHDQRLRLQGLAGRGGGDDVCASGHPGGLRHRRAATPTAARR